MPHTLRGIEPCQAVVVTRGNARSPLVADFRQAARAHLTGP
jgi:hypothetical protein